MKKSPEYGKEGWQIDIMADKTNRLRGNLLIKPRFNLFKFKLS